MNATNQSAPQTTASVAAAIDELLRDCTSMTGRRFETVDAVDGLLDLAWSLGSLRCDPVNNQQWRLAFPVGDYVQEVPHRAGTGKLRSMCARLAVLCHE